MVHLLELASAPVPAEIPPRWDWRRYFGAPTRRTISWKRGSECNDMVNALSLHTHAIAAIVHENAIPNIGPVS